MGEGGGGAYLKNLVGVRGGRVYLQFTLKIKMYKMTYPNLRK